MAYRKSIRSLHIFKLDDDILRVSSYEAKSLMNDGEEHCFQRFRTGIKSYLCFFVR